jgi:hypothetical protein
VKGIGFIGILAAAGGAILIYSGFTGKSPRIVIAALLQGKTPASDPVAPASDGSSGGSGFDTQTPATAGSGAGGGGGGGW